MIDIKQLKPGVRVKCGEWIGVVVFNNFTGEYSGQFDESWKDQGPGFMVNYDKAGLVFQSDVDEDLVIIG